MRSAATLIPSADHAGAVLLSGDLRKAIVSPAPAMSHIVAKLMALVA
jgi:hypothetical protein